MSFPNIPNITPSISLSRVEVVNLLLASIAFEELGLAHIINAEAEKIQAVLGTLPGTNAAARNISDLLASNTSVNKILKTVIKKEMLLQFKLEDILENLLSSSSTTSTTTTTATTTSTTMSTTTPIRPLFLFGDIAAATGTVDDRTVTDADDAFYHANFEPVISGYNITETPIIGVPTIPQPSIHIVKKVSVDKGSSWIDANAPIGPELLPGSKPWFRITVSNNGNVPLFNVTITDPSLGLIAIFPSLVNGAGVQFLAIPI